MTQRLRTLRAGGLALMVTLALTACGDMFGPGTRPTSHQERIDRADELSSGPTGEAALSSRHANRESQAAWAVAEADNALSVLGQEEGWFDLQFNHRSWADARQRTHTNFTFGPCALPEDDHEGRSLPGEDRWGGQLQLTLIHR